MAKVYESIHHEPKRNDILSSLQGDGGEPQQSKIIEDESSTPCVSFGFVLEGMNMKRNELIV